MSLRTGLSGIRRYATVAADAAVDASSSAASSSTSRVYTQRKTFLFNYYTHLLQRSDVVLLFKHANLTVAESTALRNAVAAVPVPAGSEGAQGEGARLTIARTGLLGPAVHSAQPEGARLTQHLDGQTALVTVPTLSPKYISGVLSAIDKVIKKAQKDPGNDKTKVVKQPAFTLVAGVLEGNRLFEADAIRDVSKLPELSTLHAQLVGLLESPGRQLVGVLSQAGGGALVRTLQGLEQGLKDKEAKAE